MWTRSSIACLARILPEKEASPTWPDKSRCFLAEFCAEIQEQTGNGDRGDGRPSSPPTPPYMRVRIRRFSELSPRGPKVRGVVRHKGFAALQVSVSASPSSEP